MEKITGARVELFLTDDKTGEKRVVEAFNEDGPAVLVQLDQRADIGTIHTADEPRVFRYHTGGRHIVLRVDVNVPDTGPKR